MSEYSWQPATAAQQAALDSEADILFFGGSAGSLKTETMLMDAVQEHESPKLRAIIFRASFPEMSDIIDKSQRLYRPLGGKYVGSPKYEWKFPSGAVIRFAYMACDDDVWKYLGPRYSFIGFDESTLHTEKQVRNIMGRLSSTDKNLRLRVRLGSNPGNVGAGWHQNLFLRGACPIHAPQDCAIPGKLYRDRQWPSDGQPIPFSVSFIPGKLSDHKLLDENYAQRLHMMAGSSAAAMEEGCWCSLEGAYFSFLTKGMIKPLADCGVEWWHNHFLSIDYGVGKSSASAGLYVRSPGDRPPARIPGIDPSTMEKAAPTFPEGRIRKIGELVRPNMSAHEFAEAVVESLIRPLGDGNGHRIVAVFMDPANFNPTYDVRSGVAGHAISDQFNEVFAPWGLVCQPASNNRIAGWQLLYRMLRSGEFEIADVCPKTFEAIRTRMHSEDKPGDIKKVAGEDLDDVADETRYALFSWIGAADKPRELILKETIQRLCDESPGALPLTSINIRYQQKEEELDRLEAPLRMGTRLGLRRR